MRKHLQEGVAKMRLRKNRPMKMGSLDERKESKVQKKRTGCPVNPLKKQRNVWRRSPLLIKNALKHYCQREEAAARLAAAAAEAAAKAEEAIAEIEGTAAPEDTDAPEAEEQAAE